MLHDSGYAVAVLLWAHYYLWSSLQQGESERAVVALFQFVGCSYHWYVLSCLVNVAVESQ